MHPLHPKREYAHVRIIDMTNKCVCVCVLLSIHICIYQESIRAVGKRGEGFMGGWLCVCETQPVLCVSVRVNMGRGGEIMLKDNKLVEMGCV